MHLQIKTKVSASGSNGPGAQSIGDDGPGITVARPGRLLALLDLLAEDQRAEGDGHDAFNLVMAGGSAIETTGTFVFAVEGDLEHEQAEHDAAVRRIQNDFPRSRVVEQIGRRLQHREGALAEFVREITAAGLLIDEIFVGVAGPDPGGSGEITVPVQVHTIRAI